jgi:hypothetical protein
VNVQASVIVGANVAAQANVVAGAGGAVFYGGGGGGGYLMPGSPGLIQGLNVDNADNGLRRLAYDSTRSKVTKVVLQAVCLDDKDVPHPASQVSPDRDIDDAYDGEVYRCIAGTRLQYTFAEFSGKVAFDHGQTITCQKNEALYHAPGGHGEAAAGGVSGGGALQCRPQKPARDCNERSLLRRFGAGVKVLTLVTTERYTAYREETTQSTATTSLSLDGGVGGVMY